MFKPTPRRGMLLALALGLSTIAQPAAHAQDTPHPNNTAPAADRTAPASDPARDGAANADTPADAPADAPSDTAPANPDSQETPTEDTSTKVPLSCYFTFDRGTAVGSAPTGRYLESAGYVFPVTMNITAPSRAVVGQPFSYKVEGARFSIPKKLEYIASGYLSSNSYSLETEEVSRASMRFPAAANTTITGVDIAENTSGVQAQAHAKYAHIAGSDTIDHVSAPKDLDHAGLSGVVGTDSVDVQFPDFTVNMVATSPGEVAPEVISSGIGGFFGGSVAADKAFVSALAQFNYLSSKVEAEANALVRCTPEKGSVKLPSVTVVAATEQVVSQITLNATPAQVHVGKEVTFNGKVTDADGYPVANKEVTLVIGDRTLTVTTNEQGEFSATATATTAGVLSAAAAVGEVTGTTTVAVNSGAIHTFSMDLPETAVEGEEVTVTVHARDDQGRGADVAQIELAVGEEKVTVPAPADGSGAFVHRFIPTAPGALNVTATAPGVQSVAKTVEVTAAPAQVALEVAAQARVGQPVPIKVIVTDKRGERVDAPTMQLTHGTHAVSMDRHDTGMYSATFSPATAGTHELRVSVPKLPVVTATVEVQPAPVVTVDVTEDDGKVTITATAKNEDNSVLAHTPVTIMVGDDKHEGETNEKGEYTLQVAKPLNRVKVTVDVLGSQKETYIGSEGREGSAPHNILLAVLGSIAGVAFIAGIIQWLTKMGIIPAGIGFPRR
ncbi:hypothetical protein P4N68_01045 [Corynebacterium felinum]|uniref:Protocatechuate 3,4-dioxygenase beta subunit n=1 Tax=Corynebacterium felinum TaxID=131318 RepID=A0ABU2B4P8_9CORY|nr:hypothetical protein [Corynebacterium felinum]MDF5819666.1 hypothetical protein [Corynebacterium felinum]MDR7353592.1 protocatechuate 3,4-dioxygenase beta subunit [Corynebacterium felinum]WJY95772.1 Filamin repeat protein [Corynebacterium felinum]